MTCMLKINSMSIVPAETNGVSNFRLYVNQVHVSSHPSEQEAFQHYIDYRVKLTRLHNVMAHFADRYASEVSAGMSMKAGSYLIELYANEVTNVNSDNYVVELINNLIDPNFINLT